MVSCKQIEKFYNDKLDKCITELKEFDYHFIGGIVDIFKSYLPLKKIEIKICLEFANLNNIGKDDLNFIYSQLGVV